MLNGGVVMFAMNLIDAIDFDTNYGILICNNDKLTVGAIQKKIVEIKERLDDENIEWVIEDIIERLPEEWEIMVQYSMREVVV
jgi:hypoxanthine-guanine phosphoribosyltransferase